MRTATKQPDIFSALIEELQRAGFSLPDQQRKLQFLLILLRQHIITKPEKLEAVRYFQSLLERLHFENYLHTAIDLFTHCKFLPVQVVSLRRLTQLRENHLSVYNQLFHLLEHVFQKHPTLALKASHIDTIISSFEKRRGLPDDCFAVLTDFLQHHTLKKTLKDIACFRNTHIKSLDRSAKEHHLLHHTVAHAQEVRARTLHFLKSQGILQSKKGVSVFLKNLVSIIVEFHDLVQDDPGTESSLELASAKKLVDWFTSHWKIRNQSPLYKIIDYLADLIIVLGTTMIYSPMRTVDLLELYLLFEPIFLKAFPEEYHYVNKGFIQLSMVVAIATGVCDKNPASLCDVVNSQCNEPSLHSLPRLKRSYQEPLILDRFFSSSYFHFYYHQHSQKDPSSHEITLNTQTFIIAFIPHLCMRIELFAKQHPEQAEILIDWIHLVRRNFFSRPPSSSLCHWFKQTGEAIGVQAAFEEIFFSALSKEQDFCLSQKGGLLFMQSFIKQVGLSARASSEKEFLINPNVPMIDFINLRKLHLFYERLKPQEKASLVNELILLVVFQAGAILEHEDLHFLQGKRATPLLRPKPTPLSFFPDIHPINKTEGNYSPHI